MQIQADRSTLTATFATATLACAITSLALRYLGRYAQWQHPLQLATALAGGATIATRLVADKAPPAASVVNPGAEIPTIRGTLRIVTNATATKRAPWEGVGRLLLDGADGFPVGTPDFWLEVEIKDEGGHGLSDRYRMLTFLPSNIVTRDAERIQFRFDGKLFNLEVKERAHFTYYSFANAWEQCAQMAKKKGLRTISRRGILGAP